MSETDVLPDLVSYNAYYLMFKKFRTVPAMLRGGTYQNERDAALQRSTFMPSRRELPVLRCHWLSAAVATKLEQDKS